MTVPVWEIAVVVVVLGVALAWGGRAAWRAIHRGGVCSDCADSGECPLANDPEFLERIGREGKMPLLENCGPNLVTCRELAEGLDGDPAQKGAAETGGEGPAND